MLRRTFLAVLGVVSAVPAARAHAILVASVPAPDGRVMAGTLAMEFRFNSRIDRSRSQLTLTRPGGARSPLPIASGGPDDVLRTTSTLEPGEYAVRWQVLSVDGHITRGDVAFTVTSRP